MDAVSPGAAMTVVVGVDDSPESDAALDWARSFVGDDGRIVVVHAWAVPIGYAFDSQLVADEREYEDVARRGLDERVAGEGDPRLEACLRRGHPGHSLVTVADDVDADLVVVGHRGSSRLSMLLGSTANHVVHHCERPIVVVRGDHRPTRRHVIVGVDDTDGPDEPSIRALRWSYLVPGVERITVLHSWEIPAWFVGAPAVAIPDRAEMDDAAREVAARAVTAAGPAPAGVEVTAASRGGSGGFALVEMSKQADLVVVGRRGRGGFAGLVLGSTSVTVAAHAHCPVVIVR